MNMIPKIEMKTGMYYSGICRNSYMALWNGKEFEYFRYKFGHYQHDTIEHFEDVKESGGDGFIPLEEIADIDDETENRIKLEVGY